MVTRWSGELSQLRRIAFDTNALIYAIELREPYAPFVSGALDRVRQGLAVGIISTVVEMELLVQPLQRSDERALDHMNLFFRSFPGLLVQSVDRAIGHHAALLRARYHLHPMDAIVVATAIEHGADALIGNDAFLKDRTPNIPYLLLSDYI